MELRKNAIAFGIALGLIAFLASCESSTSSGSSSSDNSSSTNTTTPGGGSASGGSASGTFTDSRDGQTYKYVKIGMQTWMAQNLNYRHTSGKSDTIGVCYNHADSNCMTYGRMYTWSEVMAGSPSSSASPSGVQGICPSGWHVPSDAEWQSLEVAVGMSAADAVLSGWRGTAEGAKLKANSSLWRTNTGTDVYGFSALPAGYRLNDGMFYDLGGYTYFWSSSEGNALNAWYRFFSYGFANVDRGYHSKSNGFSLRCAEN